MSSVSYTIKVQTFALSGDSEVTPLASYSDLSLVKREWHSYRQDLKTFNDANCKVYASWVDIEPSDLEKEGEIYNQCFDKEQSAIAANMWRQSIENCRWVMPNTPAFDALLSIRERRVGTKPFEKERLDRFEYLLSRLLIGEVQSSTDYSPDATITSALNLSGLDLDIFSLPSKSFVSASMVGGENKILSYRFPGKRGEISLKDYCGWSSL